VAGVNKAIIVGNLGRTEWHKVVAFGRLAEICGQYLHKGKQVYIEGRIQTRSWDDKETGAKKYMTEIVANEMQMLGRAGESSGGSGGGGQGSSFAGKKEMAAPAGGPAPAAAASEDDDLPF